MENASQQRVARWLSPKYRTLAAPVSLARTFDLFPHVLSGITINIIPDKELKYRAVRLNTGHLATLSTDSAEKHSIYQDKDGCLEESPFVLIYVCLLCV